MNTLLAALASGEHGGQLADDVLHARTLDLLEWDAVLDQVAAPCRTRAAAAAIRTARPFVDPEPIALRRTLADELRPLLETDDPPPLVEISDALDLLESPRPWRFEGIDLVRIASMAAAVEELRGWCAKHQERLPRWGDGARTLRGLQPVQAAVERVLERDGTLRDDASPELSRLRRRARDLEGRLRDSMGRLLAEAQRRGHANGPEVTLRGERFCLPLRASAKRRIDGIVHDRSASGGTVYIEPSQVVGQQNDLVECRLDAAAEIERLYLQLNAVVEANEEALHEGGAFLLRVDAAVAALRWSRKVRGVRPDLVRGGGLELHRARHPLLLAADDSGESVVPLDLDWPDGCRAVVVSGPNAGGKSVALKGVGLQVLLAQCGWDVPAAPGTRLPLVRRLCADMGDDQSIARSLSSFSAHLGHLERFLSVADADTLVLCDEIGSGTDPDEGTALAFGVLEDLVARGALVLASTHYGLLKAAVDDHPAMHNAAMDFDEKTLEPTFKLRMGVPGASHAFDIAARLGLPRALLERARERLGEDRFRIERLLTELGTRSAELEEAQGRLAGLLEDSDTRSRELDERLGGIDQERRRVLEETRREGETLLQEARRELERVVRDIRTDGAAGETIRYGRDTLDRFAAALPDAQRPREDAPIALGDRVRIPHLGLTGVVLEIRGAKIVADARGMRLSLDRQSVETLTEEQRRDDAQETETRPASRWNWQGSDGPATHEIDLRGQRAEEGWEALDRLLDRVIPTGAVEVSVIHGHGTGRLRTHLRRMLDADSRVQGCEDAPVDSGGAGRTIVRLAGA